MKAEEAMAISLSKKSKPKYRYSSKDDFVREICLCANKGKRHWTVNIWKIDQELIHDFVIENGYGLSILNNPFWPCEYKLKITW